MEPWAQYLGYITEHMTARLTRGKMVDLRDSEVEMYHGDYNLPGQLPLWGETCRKCGLAIEADHYGIFRTTDANPQAICAAGGLHEPAGPVT